MPSYEASQSSRTSSYHGRSQDSSYLRPEDAIHVNSPPRRGARQSSPLGRSDTVTTATGGMSEARKRREKRRGRSGSRRRKGTWKKLLWVRQSYPDNYTDEDTFLDHLQRNPRLRPYEFWPLVADSTIIVQHVCSVVIFVCCFTAIYKNHVSPQTVVSWATTGVVIGWVLRDYWQSQEEEEEEREYLNSAHEPGEDDERISTSSGSAEFSAPSKRDDMRLALS